MQQIIAAIETRIATERLLCSTPVTQLTRSDECICTTVLMAGKMTEIHSDRVVFAMPPRLVEQSIAFDPRTATQLDQDLPNHHAFGTITDMAEPEWDGKIIWSGSETADGHDVHFGGYLEGAVASSVRTVGLLEPEM